MSINVQAQFMQNMLGQKWKCLKKVITLAFYIGPQLNIIYSDLVFLPQEFLCLLEMCMQLKLQSASQAADTNLIFQSISRAVVIEAEWSHGRGCYIRILGI